MINLTGIVTMREQVAATSKLIPKFDDHINYLGNRGVLVATGRVGSAGWDGAIESVEHCPTGARGLELGLLHTGAGLESSCLGMEGDSLGPGRGTDVS